VTTRRMRIDESTYNLSGRVGTASYLSFNNKDILNLCFTAQAALELLSVECFAMSPDSFSFLLFPVCCSLITSVQHY
jgi:hypothetical protein